MPHLSNVKKNPAAPNVNHDEHCRFVKDITDGTILGYKYFSFEGQTQLHVTARGTAGTLVVKAGDRTVGSIRLDASMLWTESEETSFYVLGIEPLYLCYCGKGKIDLLDFTLS